MSNLQIQHPWQQQPSESVEAFEAFQLYRDMGSNRSILKVSIKLAKSHALARRWSFLNHWVARASAWDKYIDDQRTEGAAQEAKDQGIAWEERRGNLMLSDYSTGMQLFRKARTIIDGIDLYGGNSLPLIEGVKTDETSGLAVHMTQSADDTTQPADETIRRRRPLRSAEAAQSRKLKALRHAANVLKNAASIAREGSALAWGAVNVGLADHLAAMTNQTSKIDPLFNSELDPPIGSSIFGK